MFLLTDRSATRYANNCLGQAWRWGILFEGMTELMTWLQRYRIEHYVRNSIWIYPVITMAMALIAVRLLHWFEQSMGWEANVDPETARSVLGALAGAMFTFIVFVCSSLLLVVQLA